MRKEHLEWEVRGTVMALLARGYTTYYSGYKGSDGLQTLAFVSLEPPPEEVLKRVWQLTDETGIVTWENGVSKIEHDSLCDDYNRGNPLYLWGIDFIDSRGDPDLIKQHWDRIAALFPDLGWHRLVEQNSHAQKFRQTHTLQT